MTSQPSEAMRPDLAVRSQGSRSASALPWTMDRKRSIRVRASPSDHVHSSIAEIVRVPAPVRWMRFSVIRRAIVRADGGLRSTAHVMRCDRRRRVTSSRTTRSEPPEPEARRRRLGSAPSRQAGSRYASRNTKGESKEPWRVRNRSVRWSRTNRRMTLRLRPVRRTIFLIDAPLAVTSVTMAFASSQRR